ncbi:hypothetical protein RHGRI_007897 [Rhododendron griersonianum]|uniref:Uncharacterized protein n=1 Tax=Rhododendron griersonianum TaxID=479676 RepID=A0AAV6HWJ8_9ERIC|nr:hypothetical protein RHGRI_037196 [Rhododendron griersonianum]KAG5557808.1 hypothetical protein RHGRI_007897 [Rhododendron griersonianum]
MTKRVSLQQVHVEKGKEDTEDRLKCQNEFAFRGSKTTCSLHRLPVSPATTSTARRGVQNICLVLGVFEDQIYDCACGRSRTRLSLLGTAKVLSLTVPLKDPALLSGIIVVTYFLR